MDDSRLAIFGGDPVRKQLLPYSRQWISEEDIQAVVHVLESDYLTTGPEITAFEDSIAQYVGAKYAVAFANGTAALHGACFAAGIKPHDEVITSPLTFASSANCILYQGGVPIFADIDLQTYNIDPTCIEDLITSRTKAIIPVDFAGLPADLDSIKAIAKKYQLTIIEDGAHALGAHYKKKKVGSISDMTMFSFHPVKHITTGEGGVITTDNPLYLHKLRLFRTHGITRDLSHLNIDLGPWHYEMQCLGFNYRMTDIQAALGSSQLKKLDLFIRRRRQIAEAYTEAFRGMEEVICPSEYSQAFSCWHLYVIRLNLKKLLAGRKEIYKALIQENIGVNVHYIPVYLHPYYQKELGYPKGLCPNSEKIYEEILTLPLFPAMQTQDIQDVIKAVRKVIAFYTASGRDESL